MSCARPLGPVVFPVGGLGQVKKLTTPMLLSPPDALISWDFSSMHSAPGGRIPDLFVPDAHKATLEEGLVSWVSLSGRHGLLSIHGAEFHEACPLSRLILMASVRALMTTAHAPVWQRSPIRPGGIAGITRVATLSETSLPLGQAA